MFAFQICDMPQTDQKITHCEFLGCIAEDVEEEEEESEDQKRGEFNAATSFNDFLKTFLAKKYVRTTTGIEDVAMEDMDDPASKRIKRT